MAFTDDLANRLAEYLKDDFDSFRYFRSRAQFRKNDKEFSDDLIINVTSRGGESYTLGFYTGVGHNKTEKLIASAEERKVSPYDRTIHHFSPNTNKQDIISYGGEGWWWGLPRDEDFSAIGDSIRYFINEFVFPYFERFHDLERIRESLVLRDGLSMNFMPFKQVLAIDLLTQREERIISYAELLQSELDSGYLHRWQEFNEFYSKLRMNHADLIPEFQLSPKPSKHNKSSYSTSGSGASLRE